MGAYQSSRQQRLEEQELAHHIRMKEATAEARHATERRAQEALLARQAADMIHRHDLEMLEASRYNQRFVRTVNGHAIRLARRRAPRIVMFADTAPCAQLTAELRAQGYTKHLHTCTPNPHAWVVVYTLPSQSDPPPAYEGAVGGEQ